MELLRLATAGSVDDGKSTLIGRLLYDSKAIFEDQLESVERVSRQRGDEYTDLALLTDGLRAEREQGITIDVAYRYFATPARKFIIADTPGHIQYTRNMVTGNSTADLTIVLVDARKGIVEQTRRHAFLASLLRVPHLLLCVNKMDLVEFDREVFESIREEFAAFASRLEVSDLSFIPISALQGDNVVQRSANMPWYEGASLLHHLEQVYISSDRNLIDPRLPVQWVVRPQATSHPDYRGYAGRVAGGVFKPGDEVMVLPSGLTTTVAGIDTFDGQVDEAFPPMSVTIRLTDDIDISRGDMICRPAQPADGGPGSRRHGGLDDRAAAGRGRFPRPQAHHPLGAGRGPRHPLPARRQHPAPGRDGDVPRPQRRRSGQPAGHPAALLRQLPAQPADRVVHSGRRGHQRDRGRRHAARARLIVGSTMTSSNVTWHPGTVSREERAERFGSRGATLWFTGLSGSGKSTLAVAVEQRLVAEGRNAYRLDGDNLRTGLNGDLGFSRDDRNENVRRVAEVACLFADAGLVAIVALISPYAESRQRARQIHEEAGLPFVEVYMAAPADLCANRDPKGLYARASEGAIDSFTGVDDPYEVPESPDLCIESGSALDRSMEAVMAKLAQVEDTIGPAVT